MRRCTRWWLACALALISRPGIAQDEAAAGALFDRGLADMQAGKLDTGCPALAESQRLDPRPGSLFTLAECEAAWGKLASSVAHYDDYLRWYARMSPADQGRQGERAKIARERKAELAPKVPELTMIVSKAGPAGVEVRRDDVVLGAASLGVPLPIDPGEHVIRVTAAGRSPEESASRWPRAQGARSPGRPIRPAGGRRSREGGPAPGAHGRADGPVAQSRLGCWRCAGRLRRR